MTSKVFIPQDRLKTAVLFLVFNRPNTTYQVFEAIKQAKPPRLYIAADGPREGKKGEVELVEKVRKIATAVDWPCEVKTLFRNKNLGCKNAVSAAITWFFDNEEQGIILEDDCLPSQSFFWFCEFYLNAFKNNECIGSISGNLRKYEEIKTGYPISKSHYFNMWGWATWRRVWSNYSVDYFENFKDSPKFYNNFSSQKVKAYWSDIYLKMHNREIDTWDYQLMFLFFDKKMISIYPQYNLVRNLGFGKESTHCSDPNDSSARISSHEINCDFEVFSINDISNIDDFLNVEYQRKNFIVRFFKKIIQYLFIKT